MIHITRLRDIIHITRLNGSMHALSGDEESWPVMIGDVRGGPDICK